MTIWCVCVLPQRTHCNDHSVTNTILHKRFKSHTPMIQSNNPKKDLITKKVLALLAKTEDNGATQAEAISAMEKARILMESYYISDMDLQDPFIHENMIIEEVPMSRGQYDWTFFYADLCSVFDCEHMYNKHRVAFFGYEKDVQLCSYFFSMIMRIGTRSLNEFKGSEDYREATEYHHAKTVISSFIKGFTFSIAVRLRDMYENRYASMDSSSALILTGKAEKVKEQFKNGFDVKMKKPSSASNASSIGFTSGEVEGDNVPLTKGMERSSYGSPIKQLN